MASTLKQLSDDDLEAIRHMIRRDAHTDLQIAEEAEKRGKQKIAATAKGKECAIARYRQGKEYARWLKNWESRDVELKRVLELQKQRFELLSNLIKDPSSNGMDTLAKSLQARLLTLAAEASDEELVEGATKNGWIKNVIRVVQEQSKITDRSKADQLKAEIDRLSSGGEKKIDPRKLVERVDDVMGLTKKS